MKCQESLWLRELRLKPGEYVKGAPAPCLPILAVVDARAREIEDDGAIMRWLLQTFSSASG
jgi:hypothetical protein